MKFLPNSAELKALGMAAAGGLAGQTITTLLNDKVEFLSDKQYITDIVVLLGGVAVMKVKNMRSVGTGLALVGMTNLLERGLDKVMGK